MSDLEERPEVEVIVRAAWVPARGDPAHAAELVSQWLCGETLAVLEASGEWLRCRGDDGYVAWTPAGGVLQADAAASETWRASATAFSLGVALERDVARDAGGLPLDRPGARPGPSRLPFGARVAPLEDGAVRLPDGTEVRLSDPARIVIGHLAPDPEAVLACATSWIGTPYVWGGRSDWGADCSGFVQLVYAAHGVRLPRDSYQQFDAGPALAEGEPVSTGDLLFYAETPGRVTHVAICLDDRHVIHCSTTNAAVAINDMEGGLPLEEKLRHWRVGATRPLATD